MPLNQTPGTLISIRRRSGEKAENAEIESNEQRYTAFNVSKRQADHCEKGAAKSSNRVLLSRLEIRIARRNEMRRAVSRLVGASYANHEAQLSQFKQAALFRMRRRAIARNRCVAGSWGVQIQSPFSEFGSLLRVLIGVRAAEREGETLNLPTEATKVRERRVAGDTVLATLGTMLVTEGSLDAGCRVAVGRAEGLMSEAGASHAMHT